MPVFCLFTLCHHGNFTAGVTIEQPYLLCTALALNIELLSIIVCAVLQMSCQNLTCILQYLQITILKKEHHPNYFFIRKRLQNFIILFLLMHVFFLPKIHGRLLRVCIYKNTIKPIHAFTSIKQSPVLKGHFLFGSVNRKFHMN